MDMLLDEYKTDLTVLSTGAGYWDRETGEFVKGALEEKPFIGAILPLSQDDYVKNADGGYSRKDRKLYTSESLLEKQEVVWDNHRWQIESVNNYDYIDPDFKRYFMRRVGKIDD